MGKWAGAELAAVRGNGTTGQGTARGHMQAWGRSATDVAGVCSSETVGPLCAAVSSTAGNGSCRQVPTQAGAC